MQSTHSDPYAQVPITDLHLIPRCQNALLRAGIQTIGRFESKDADGSILNVRDIGPNTAAEIRNAIAVFRKAHPADDLFKIVGDFMLVNDTTWIKISLISKVVTLIVRRDSGPDEYGTIIYLQGSESPTTIPCNSAEEAIEQTKKIINMLAESKESA